MGLPVEQVGRAVALLHPVQVRPRVHRRAVEGADVQEPIHIPRVRRAEIPVPVLIKIRKDTVPWCQEIIALGTFHRSVLRTDMIGVDQLFDVDSVIPLVRRMSVKCQILFVPVMEVVRVARVVRRLGDRLVVQH